MSIGKNLQLRGFLEGVEIPVIAASVQFGVNQPATAVVSIVPSAQVRRIKARTVVHLFYLDDREDTTVTGDALSSDPQWKLLFNGEVHGWRWTKSEDSRVASLICKDDTTYWDLVKKYYYNELSFNFYQKKANVFQDGVAMPYDYVLGPAASLAALIRKKCRTYPGMKGLLSGLIRLLESLGGYHEGGRHTRGVGDFFTAAQLRLKFYQQIGASDKDDTAFNLLSSKEFYDWVRNLVSQGGNMFTLRQTLDAVLQVIFYQYISNPVAKLYTSPEKKNARRVKHIVEPANDLVLNDVITVMTKISQVLGSSKHVPVEFNPSIPADPWPHIVPVDPGVYSSTSANLGPNESGSNLVTSAQRAVLESAKGEIMKWNELAKKAREESKARPSIPVIDDRIAEETGDPSWMQEPQSVDPQYNDIDCVGESYSQSTFTRTVTPTVANKAYLHLEAALEYYQTFLKRFSARTFYNTWEDVPPDERLYTTILAPDLFFAAPPTCNIIFPDDYTRLDGSRVMTEEVSRLMLVTPMVLLGVEGGGLPFDNKLYHFSPMVNTIDGIPIKKAISKTRRFLLPNEVYTGPIPYIDWFSDIRQYDPILMWKGKSIIKELHENQRTQQLHERGVADNIPYLQHVSNFTLTRMRYANRTMSVPMRFNPSIVAGFPAVVIDKYQGMSQVEVGDMAIDFPEPSRKAEHWLGVPVQVVHTITQSAAETTAVLNYVHSHTETDELFEAIKLKETKRTLVPGTARYKVVEPYDGNASNIVFPRYGEVISVEFDHPNPQNRVAVWKDKHGKYRVSVDDYEVTPGDYNRGGPGPKVYTGFTRRNEKESYVVGVSDEAIRESTNVPDSTVAKFYMTGADLHSLLTTFTCRITERVMTKAPDVNTTIVEDIIPFEEQVRPPWISTCYSNKEIGKYYQELLGCGSIIDLAANMTDPKLKDEVVSLGKYGTFLQARLSSENSVRAAVDNVARLYNIAKSSGDSQVVEELVYFLRKRSVATIWQILGTPDLTYKPNGDPNTGYEGFHSKAFGDAPFKPTMVGSSDTTGLKELPVMNPSVDPRPARRAIIEDYLDSIYRPDDMLG